ncbi:MAG: hypothetical protein ACWA41_11805 [Putridiphycobacter sp.]
MKKIITMGLILLSVTACQEEEVTPVDNSTATTTPNSYYISFDIGSTSYLIENGVDGFQANMSNSKDVDAANNFILAHPGSGLINFGNMHSYYISFNNYQFQLDQYSNDKAAALASILSVGNYSFYDAANPGNTFVDVSHKEGTLFKAENGTQPSTSTLSITESTAATDGAGEPYQDVKGTFSCQVFDSSGNAKTLSNGAFYLYFYAP